MQDEASFYMQPYHQLRHPLVFYYGHPASLYINKLRVAGVTKTAPHIDAPPGMASSNINHPHPPPLTKKTAPGLELLLPIAAISPRLPLLDI